MRRHAPLQRVLSGLGVALLGYLIVASSASASRVPTKAERASLTTTALAQCNKEDGPCTWRSALISTRNSRYALVNATGSFIDYNVIYRRDTPTATRWRSRLVLSNGVTECTRLLRAAPREVLRDLRIQGLKGSTGGGYCGY